MSELIKKLIKKLIKSIIIILIIIITIMSFVFLYSIEVELMKDEQLKYYLHAKYLKEIKENMNLIEDIKKR